MSFPVDRDPTTTTLITTTLFEDELEETAPGGDRLRNTLGSRILETFGSICYVDVVDKPQTQTTSTTMSFAPPEYGSPLPLRPALRDAEETQAQSPKSGPVKCKTNPWMRSPFTTLSTPTQSPELMEDL